ncbi:hypothetical protein J6590_058349 [Homalodisca vitripennis]|nr:hypothetical protein J6590_058349 [Homalodisca vitripennis]
MSDVTQDLGQTTLYSLTSLLSQLLPSTNLYNAETNLEQQERAFGVIIIDITTAFIALSTWESAKEHHGG